MREQLKEQLWIRALGTLLIIQAALYLVPVPSVLLTARMVSQMGGELPEQFPSGSVGRLADLKMVLVNKGLVPHFIAGVLLLSMSFVVAGVGLWRLRDWGRRFAVVVALVGLPVHVVRVWLIDRGEPLALALGWFAWAGMSIVVLWTLFHPQYKKHFNAS